MGNSSQILLLTLTVWFTATASVYCQYDNPKYPFNVDENEAQVEKLVIEYSRSLPKPKTKFTELVGRVVDVVSDLTCSSDTECDSDEIESFKVENVCDLTKRNKLFLCKGAIRLNYFGLQFDTKENEDMPCDWYKISLKHRSAQKLDTDELEMFPCPPLKYIDLTTDETIFLLVRYFISSTHEPQSFFLYLQENPELPIYPHKFASGMYFSQLHKIRDHLPTDERLDQVDAGKMTLIKMASIAERKIIEFVTNRRFQNVYEKFEKFYKSRIICAMPQPHKVAACRYIAREMNLKMDYRGFDESRCRKRKVFANPASPEDVNGHFVGSLLTVKCPPLYEPDEEGNRFIFKTIFLTSNYFYESAVFVLQRLNLRGHEVKPAALTFSINLEMLSKDRRRIREYSKYLKPDNSKTFAPVSDSTRKPIRSELRKQLQSSPFTLFNRGFIEKNVISVVRMKQEPRPYQRFMQSVDSISINTWLENEIQFLCRIILEEEPYNLGFEAKFFEFAHRLHIEAELLMRDAELLPNKILVARQCSPDLQSSSTFFIVGSIRKDAAIMYVKYENESYIIPHSYVHNIKQAEIRVAVSKKKLPQSPLLL